MPVAKHRPAIADQDGLDGVERCESPHRLDGVRAVDQLRVGQQGERPGSMGAHEVARDQRRSVHQQRVLAWRLTPMELQGDDAGDDLVSLSDEAPAGNREGLGLRTGPTSGAFERAASSCAARAWSLLVTTTTDTGPRAERCARSSADIGIGSTSTTPSTRTTAYPWKPTLRAPSKHDQEKMVG